MVTGPPRFELGLTGSKPAVLPLHHGPFDRAARLRDRCLSNRLLGTDHPAPVAGSTVRALLEGPLTRLSSVKEAPCADSDEPRASGSFRVGALASTRGGSRGTPTRLQRAIAAGCTLHAAPGNPVTDGPCCGVEKRSESRGRKQVGRTLLVTDFARPGAGRAPNRLPGRFALAADPGRGGRRFAPASA